jgi:TM2 domain-containing membrane protein YozV
MSNTFTRIWKPLTFSGLGLITLGFGGFCVSFFFTGINYSALFIAIGIGLLCLFIGLIGLATRLEKQQRRNIDSLLLFLPVAICVYAGLMNPNVHGIFPLFFLASILACILGIILLLMSVKG